MENSEAFSEAAGLPVNDAPWRARASLPVPADFVPLRLVLQPSGASVALTQSDMLIGRHSLADVRLPLPDVSRRHCRFLFSQGVWQVFDLNSLNGVYLNGELIQQATVRCGDQIRIGGFTFTVEMDEVRNEITEGAASAGLIRGIFPKLARSLPTAPPGDGGADLPRRRAS